MQSLVSILIPVYNSGATIAAAIKSCLDQTYPHIEVIVLDDASTDNSMEVITQFDSLKLTVLKNDENHGIAKSRNKLLKHARGEYIAWLDADDTMTPDRIDVQTGFMTANPGIDIAGSWILTDDKGLPSKKLPLLHAQISTMLWFRNCMIQPSVMSKNFYRKENTWYDVAYRDSVEDYELWYRLAPRKKFANIPSFLTLYHMTSGEPLSGKQVQNGFAQNLGHLWVKKWKDVDVNIKPEAKKLFQEFLYTNRPLNREEGDSLRKTLISLSLIKQDPFYNLIISYLRLRLWKNMGLSQKFRRLYLLNNAVYYFKMKRNYLVN